ncbi:MAG: sialate O-acetylesterase, partial [Chitinophagales bacterium]
MRVIFFLLVFSILTSSKLVQGTGYLPKEVTIMEKILERQNVWVFILAGQSNMAGRGIVEPQDTVTNSRILSINKNGDLIIAKEPLHWYEPERTGLDCGHSFGKTIIKNLPDSISVLLIPTAVGGSSISQWLGDSLHRNVKLLSNFLAKIELSKRYGIIKGILWHQGESDANEGDILHYKERLRELFTKFRAATGNNSLPVLLGELGSFSKDKGNFSLINKAMHDYSLLDDNTAVISTGDLKDKGDSLHFDSNGQRAMG